MDIAGSDAEGSACKLSQLYLYCKDQTTGGFAGTQCDCKCIRLRNEMGGRIYRAHPSFTSHPIRGSLLRFEQGDRAVGGVTEGVVHGRVETRLGER